jgi:N-dimethylarginine dimethylaminohydrolase
MIQTAKQYRINICNTNGHSDGVFCPIAPGLLVSTHNKDNYAKSFPGWELFKIPNNLRNVNFPKNWIVHNPSIDNNSAFSQHILNRASTWVGNFSETVPEVNMLVLDEKNVVAMKEYPPLVEWLDRHGITVHHFDFRARSFWDGGWHCLTLDIHREDSKTDLFPERGENGVYWREL